MEKKNPYVTTIGFNRKDPNHVKVAEILNEMGRGKAQYIVNAVMAYQSRDQKLYTKTGDYEKIKEIVQEILKENSSWLIPEQKWNNVFTYEEKDNVAEKQEQYMETILDSLKLFQNH